MNPGSIFIRRQSPWREYLQRSYRSAMMRRIATALKISAIESLVFEILEANTPFMEKDNEVRMQPRVGSTCRPCHHRESSAATGRFVVRFSRGPSCPGLPSVLPQGGYGCNPWYRRCERRSETAPTANTAQVLGSGPPSNFLSDLDQFRFGRPKDSLGAREALPSIESQPRQADSDE